MSCFAGPKILSGLYGKRYVNYYADDVNWFKTAALHGDIQNAQTNINVFSSSADNYSWMWLGLFRSGAGGSYTFYTASDDASHLWIGDFAKIGYTTGNCVVNNGGLHGVVEQSGTITLNHNTFYPIRIMFGELSGGDVMTVSFSGPGITKTTNGGGYYFGSEITWNYLNRY